SSDYKVSGATTTATLPLSRMARIALGGDATLDEVVDTTDFNALAANFGLMGKDWADGDFNRDGTVDTADFSMLAANFGTSASMGSAALVPEPAISGLFSCLLIALSRNARRRLPTRSRRG